MNEKLQPVDHAAIRTNQYFLIALLILAFVLNLPWLVALTALALGLGTALKRPAFRFVYTGLLKPRGWVKPEVLMDHPEPHLFSQGMGSAFLGASSLAFLLGASLLGWGLAWLVAGLAALNAFGGFCAGCAVYYWLNRLNIPGFIQAPPAGTIPGMRPHGGAHGS
jgi:hypothetical protein